MGAARGKVLQWWRVDQLLRLAEQAAPIKRSLQTLSTGTAHEAPALRSVVMSLDCLLRSHLRCSRHCAVDLRVEQQNRKVVGRPSQLGRRGVPRIEHARSPDLSSGPVVGV
jgi:hypothetical protein